MFLKNHLKRANVKIHHDDEEVEQVLCSTLSRNPASWAYVEAEGSTESERGNCKNEEFLPYLHPHDISDTNYP